MKKTIIASAIIALIIAIICGFFISQHTDEKMYGRLQTISDQEALFFGSNSEGLEEFSLKDLETIKVNTKIVLEGEGKDSKIVVTVKDYKNNLYVRSSYPTKTENSNQTVIVEIRKVSRIQQHLTIESSLIIFLGSVVIISFLFKITDLIKK